MRSDSRFLELYSFNSNELICSALAIKYSKENNVPFDKAYFKINFRKVQEYSGNPDYFIKAATSNVVNYITQNFLLDSKFKIPSTKEIRNSFSKLIDCEMTLSDINNCVNWFLLRLKDLDGGNYYIINTWQLLNISVICSVNNVEKSPQNIKILFNKIYNRNPFDTEISVVQNLSPSDNTERVSNVFSEFLKVIDDSDYRRSRRDRHFAR